MPKHRYPTPLFVVPDGAIEVEIVGVLVNDVIVRQELGYLQVG